MTAHVLSPTDARFDRGRRRGAPSGRWIPLTTAPASRWTAFAVLALWAVHKQFWHLGAAGVVTDEPASQQPGILDDPSRIDRLALLDGPMAPPREERSPGDDVARGSGAREHRSGALRIARPGNQPAVRR